MKKRGSAATRKTSRRRAPASRGMAWVRAGKRRHVLRRGDETLATLEWVKGRGTLCVFEALGKRWTFKRTGFFRPRLTIRQEGSDTNFASLVVSFWGQWSVEFANGRRLRWVASSIWGTTYEFRDDAKRLAVRIGPERRKATPVLFGPGAKGKIEPLLLAGFGHYMLVSGTASDDGAAVAIMAAAS